MSWASVRFWVGVLAVLVVLTWGGYTLLTAVIEHRHREWCEAKAPEVGVTYAQCLRIQSN